MKRRGRYPEPGLLRTTDRHGKVRWLYRSTARVYQGGSTTTPYRSPDWHAWYDAAVASAHPGRSSRDRSEGAGADRETAGTISALVAKLYQQPSWKQLEPLTKSTKRNIIERLRKAAGDKQVATLQRRHVVDMVATLGSSAIVANRLLTTFRQLMDLALTLDWIKADPTLGIKPVKLKKTDGYHSWTEDEIRSFERRWPIGSRERLSMGLMLYTAQRRSDAVTMGRQHVTRETISVCQFKGGERLEVPVHPRLREILDATPPGQLTFLVTAHGAPYSAAGFGNWFREVCNAAGLPHCSAHGLRKAAARRLAEAGCSAKQIMSITGHRTLKEVELYTRAADQVRLASDAMAMVVADERGT